MVLQCSKSIKIAFKDDVTAKVHTNKFGLCCCLGPNPIIIIIIIIIITIGLCYNVYLSTIIAVF